MYVQLYAIVSVAGVHVLTISPQTIVGTNYYYYYYYFAHQHKAAGVKTKQKQRLRRLLIRCSLC